MKQYFRIKSNSKTPKKIEYLAPKFIYLPITHKVLEPLKFNDKVIKGQYLNRENYITVSGKIAGSKICYNLNKKINTLVIANNYKEQRIKKSKESKINLLDKILDSSVINKLNKGNKNLIITCFNDNSYSYDTEYLISDCYQDILDTVYFLKDLYKFQNIYLIFKDIQSKSIEKFIKVIGSYLELKFMTIPNIYPTYNTDYIEDVLKINDYCTLKFSELYDIYHITRFSFTCSEKYITINTDEKNPIIYKTKIGTSLKELLSNSKIKIDNYNIYLNGVIGGIKVDNIDDLVVTKNLDSISFTKATMPNPLKCINCGNCLNHCPKGIDPKRALLDKEYKKSIKDKCIGCGLCSYICPCYIRLKEAIERDD